MTKISSTSSVKEATVRGSMERSEVYRSSVPNLNDEFRETLRGLIAGTDPVTVTHALYIRGTESYTREGLAAAIGRPTYEIEGVLAALEEDGWVLRYWENGLEKIALNAPQTERSFVQTL